MSEEEDIRKQLQCFGYDIVHINLAMVAVSNSNDINEIIDEIETHFRTADDANQEAWIALKDVPFRSYFLSFRGTILAISFKSNLMWGDGIYIFNVDEDKWEKYMSYPNDFNTMNLSLSLNRDSKQIFGYQNMVKGKYMTKHTPQCIKVMHLQTKQCYTQPLPPPDEFALNSFDVAYVSTVFINDTYHMFSGKDDRTHSILQLHPHVHFETCCSTDSYNGALFDSYNGERWSLMYDASQQMVIFGGDYDPFISKCPLYCYKVKESKWTSVYLKISDAVKSARMVSYCYHEKTQNILMFDGLGGQHIYVVNINDWKVRVSGIRCPENKVYDAVFVSHMTLNEVIVKGYCREQIGLAALPHDIVNEIAHWMEGFDCIHLFDHNRGLCHWLTDVNSILE
eukprot:92549_1